MDVYGLQSDRGLLPHITRTYQDDCCTKSLNFILKKLEAIEAHLDIKPRSLYDNLKPALTVADAAELLGCNQTKVRQYVKWKMLDSFKVGHKIMIVTSSLRELIQINTEAQKRASNSDKVHFYRFFQWWAREDSNLRPMDYESTALTN